MRLLGVGLRTVAASGLLLLGIAVHASVDATLEDRDAYRDQLREQQAAAAVEREALVAGQRDLWDAYMAIVAGDRRLVAWLRSEGIEPPASVTRYLSTASARPAPDLPGKSERGRR